ncbi:MAG: caspase family protein [Brevinematales bacterium]|nr:caspase family protein [Brevinematales bacterium]
MLRKSGGIFLSIILIGLLSGCPGKSSVPKAGGSAVLKAVLIMEDDYDDPGLNNIADSVRADFSYISKLLDVLEKYGVINVDKIVLRGADATKDNIVKVLKKLKLNKNDVLMVYFSGHGGMENGQLFLETADIEQLYRGELEEIVEAKDAKLKLVFTDACSSSIDGLIAVKTLGGINKANKQQALVEIYKNLFLNHEGMLYMTAASEGEYAWSGDRGGAFTESLIYETLLQNPKPTWEEVCKSAKKKTQDKFQKMVSMGLIDSATLKDMKNDGIKNQTPKVYSMPVLKNEVTVDEGKIDDYQDVDKEEKSDIKIKNISGKAVTFYFDNNTSEDNWDFGNTEEINLASGKSTDLYSDNDKAVVFFIIGEDEGNFFELNSGNYLIDYAKKGELGIFYDEGESADDNQGGDKDDFWIWDSVDEDGDNSDEIDNIKSEDEWDWSTDDYNDNSGDNNDSDDDGGTDHFFGK